MNTNLRTLFTVAILVLAVGGASAQDAIILIKGDREGAVRLFNDRNGNTAKTFTAKHTDQGTVITVPGDQATDMMYLLSEDRSAWLNPVPGHTITVDMSKPQWKYEGPRRKLNEFLDRWTQEFYLGRPNELSNSFHMLRSKLPKRFKDTGGDPGSYFTPEYIGWMNRSRQKTRDGFARLRAEDPEVFQRIGRTLDYMWTEMWLMNYMMHKSAVGTTPPEAMIEVPTDDPALLDYPGGRNIVRYYLTLCDDMGMIDAASWEDLAAKAKLISDPTLREDYVLEGLDFQVNRGKYLYGTDKMLESVKEMVLSERGRKKYADLYASYRKMAHGAGDGSPMHPFEFDAVDGGKVSNKDFVGSYLFIDVWATWCGPCKAEIPFLIELEKRLAGRNIEFLSVSVDKPQDREKWVEMVGQMGVEGHHAISPNTTKHPLFASYGVTAIPRFMLVGPDGTLLMSRARRPSDPVLLKQLLELTTPL